MNYTQNQEFMRITQDILEHPAFLRTKTVIHHGKENTVYIHSVATAFFAYRTAKRLRLSDEDIISVTRAALLHDFTGYDWRKDKQDEVNYKGLRKLWHMHAFQHGYRAANNAAHYFGLSDKQKDAIKKHMFPLVPFFPRHKEGWIVTYSDKVIASKEMSQAVWNSILTGYRKLQHAFAF